MINQEKNLVVINLPTYTHPTDEEIQDNIVTGIFDLDIKMEKWADEWHGSIRNNLLKIIYRKYPVEDGYLYVSAPEEKKKAEEYVKKCLNNSARSSNHKCNDHKCGDSNCPHKAKISPFMMYLASQGPTGKVYDFSMWVPFK